MIHDIQDRPRLRSSLARLDGWGLGDPDGNCPHTVFFERSILHPPYPSLKVRAGAYEVSAETRRRANHHQPGVVALQAPADGARAFISHRGPPISTPCSAQALKSEYIAPSLASTSSSSSL